MATSTTALLLSASYSSAALGESGEKPKPQNPNQKYIINKS
jgi:hypothetical protein